MLNCFGYTPLLPTTQTIRHTQKETCPVPLHQNTQAVLRAAKDLAPGWENIAGPCQAPITEALVVLETVACTRYLIIALQENLQAEEISRLVDGPVQEEQLLGIEVGLQRPRPLDVTLSFRSNFFDVCVGTGADEAHQGFHLVTLARFTEGLQRLAVK